jgi:transposase-like protein
VRCRLAHNHDTTSRRGLANQERYTFLTMLRSGKTVEEAAEDAGVTTNTLVQAARRDGELRAALDGMPVEVQAAARRAEFLAALVRCGGNQRLAEIQAGLPLGTVNNWRQADPEFDAVVVAILAWLGSTTGRPRMPRSGRSRKPHVYLSHKDLERLRELWADGMTGDEIAAELGVNPGTVSRWREKLGLPERQTSLRASADRFRELWTSGATYAEIRTELGISDSTISSWRKQLGLPGRAAN